MELNTVFEFVTADRIVFGNGAIEKIKSGSSLNSMGK
jgi:capsid portal protein